MVDPARLSYLRPAKSEDAGLLHDIFCTTWQSEVEALPNQALARHVLRIQHTAQERRFDHRYAGLRRLLLTRDGVDAGRLYLLQTGTSVHVVDLTLLPEHRGQGIGSGVLRDLMDQARIEDQSLTLRVPRTNVLATALFERLGFALVTVDDVDCCLEWVPSRHPEEARGLRTGQPVEG